MGDYAVYAALYFAYVRYFGVETEEGFQVSGCGHVLALVAAWVVLMPLPEAFWGRTLGKWVCDLRVVGLNNRPVTIGQAFARRMLDPVDLLAFFGLVAYIVAKTNPLSQRLGDLVAKTRVVEEAAIASTAT
ncbi:MAG: RDD family protein [Acidobacteriota bacterium]|nr:RDD family protein [Acidobacteriota bacterium]